VRISALEDLHKKHVKKLVTITKTNRLSVNCSKSFFWNECVRSHSRYKKALKVKLFF